MAAVLNQDKLLIMIVINTSVIASRSAFNLLICVIINTVYSYIVLYYCLIHAAFNLSIWVAVSYIVLFLVFKLVKIYIADEHSYWQMI
jgi:hypothetical protein